jgi:hypothetical protein
MRGDSSIEGWIVLEIVKLVLEKVLSWPVIVGTIVVVFHSDIRKLMGRVATIRLLGGEVLTSQAEPRAKTAQEASPDPPGEQILPQNVPLTQGQVTLTQEQFKQLVEGLQATNARAYFWEYAYLNYFLVPLTKVVLYWIASLKDGVTLTLYDYQFAHVPAEERKAIVYALTAHLLIQVKGDLIEVTPKGREYIKLSGLLLPIPGVPGTTGDVPGATPG